MYDFSRSEWLEFLSPEKVIIGESPEDVLPLLHEINELVRTKSWYAAGFLSYEAVCGFDEALRVNPSVDFPLLWFGLFSDIRRHPDLPDDFTGSYSIQEWTPELSKREYLESIEKIRQALERGDTYQVNYSYRQQAKFSGEPSALFRALISPRYPGYGAYLNIGDYVVCSASPELFFTWEDGILTSRPMKGTYSRGRTLEEDNRFADTLHRSEKDRAENVMIVDMVRNDMGRVAEFGTVTVPDLFSIEKYPTVWQMTSTVQGKTEATIPEIMTALFPCASITGAPKVSTMRIIANLEQSPRNIYTGSIGFITPERRAQFNVAIRTALIDKNQRRIEYGTGGGIVWDSEPEKEYDEARLKTNILHKTIPDFDLLETLLWERESGYFIEEYHRRRIAGSAEYFDFAFDSDKWERRLRKLEDEFSEERYRVRVTLSRTGRISAKYLPMPKTGGTTPVKVGIAEYPIDESDPFLYHKTSYREIYEKAKHSVPDCGDVILWNSREEITESTIANVVIQLEGRLITPPVESGLLPGTFRQYLLDKGEIGENTVTVDILQQAERIYLINSVRKWRQASLVK
ncbi:MAG: aminodeoxychorismate synthase component I [Candidatus Marinimicrobia bacterium]|nr:aminodeoxychorismate synthase component I [Candidatus Neomarinimicrobiota bacterium]MCF7830230.1 aminodeoxychorismate synthase component I [Candidatus Neomarinimicrobiota bacterium]MCF7882257.1 aminodeoxychorismate synthase component I [Candidatus Neomarinimicrobiota bacterium]